MASFSVLQPGAQRRNLQAAPWLANITSLQREGISDKLCALEDAFARLKIALDGVDVLATLKSLLVACLREETLTTALATMSAEALGDWPESIAPLQAPLTEATEAAFEAHTASALTTPGVRGLALIAFQVDFRIGKTNDPRRTSGLSIATASAFQLQTLCRADFATAEVEGDAAAREPPFSREFLAFAFAALVCRTLGLFCALAPEHGSEEQFLSSKTVFLSFVGGAPVQTALRRDHPCDESCDGKCSDAQNPALWIARFMYQAASQEKLLLVALRFEQMLAARVEASIGSIA
jgi:hypothetical protein